MTEKAPTTAKDFFVWASIIITLYWSTISFGQLVFLYIAYQFPDPTVSFDPYQSGISYYMASLLVLFPIFLILFTLYRKDIAHDPLKEFTWVRRWGVFLTLFVSSIAIAADLITLLNTFFSEGDILVPFLLKIGAVFFLAAIVFLYFLAELRGYWNVHKSLYRLIGYISLVVVLCTIGIGFAIVGSPQHERLVRLDTQKVSDLQSLESQIDSYYNQNHVLPKSLSSLNSSAGFIPTDPQSGDQYGYTVVSTKTFSLCAMFNTSSTFSYKTNSPLSSQSWNHGSGYTCFTELVITNFIPYTSPSAVYSIPTH